MDARGYIPVVDFTAYGLEKDSQSAEPDSLKKLASEIHTAFTTIGFVYLKNHGISESLVRLIELLKIAFYTEKKKQNNDIHFITSIVLYTYRQVERSSHGGSGIALDSLAI